MITNLEFVEKLKDIATNYKTLYVMGCFGAPMTGANKTRYINNGAHNSFNARESRKAMITASSADTFGFDCVCLIKGVLWGWNGDRNSIYGGAKYGANGVPDIGTEQIINVCSDVSTDFNKIEVGELVHLVGHVGVYIGDGLVVECTPAWSNNVQVTACNQYKSGYNTRFWKDHGKLPYITYVKENKESENKPMTQEEKKAFEKLTKSVEQLSEAYKGLSTTCNKLKKSLDKYDAAGVYDNAAIKWESVDNLPTWAKPTITKLVDKKILEGNEKNSLELSRGLMRTLVMLDRAGKLD